MKLILVPLDKLGDAPRNANKMSPAKFQLLVESIKRVGFVQHVLVRAIANERWEMVDGHHRRDALRILGHDAVPAVELEGDEDPRLVALALNRIRGETDLAAASLVIEELTEAGFNFSDLTISGFSDRELSELVAALESTDDPSLDDLDGLEEPEPVGTPVARPFLLELTFASKADLVLVRKALRKAAGKGGNLADGLLRVVRPE
jgi:ParB-like chromosome segregation protein Spo0J